MTREEAIIILKNLLKELTKDFDVLTEEEHEAYNMALSSLEIDDMNDMSRKEALEYEHIPTITITVEEYIRLRECEAKCMMEGEDEDETNN